MAYTSLGNGFEITGANYIDRRIVLTKAEMLTAEDDYFLPDIYFAFCPDDNQWYCYNIDNEDDPETGKYRVLPTGLVKDVRIEGISILDSEGIADFEFPVKDVMVNGTSVVEDKVANIDLSDFQKKLTAGENIKIENNVISVDSEAIPKKTSDLINDSGFIDSEAVPTKLSELENDEGFIDSEAQNLKYYYTKDQIYTQKEVDDLVEPLKDGIVQDVLVNGTSVVTDNVAHVNIIDDVKVDGTSVVDRGIANISLAHKQDKLTAGRNIDINNNVISVEGLKTYSAGYGLNLSNDGQFSADVTKLATLDKIPSNVSQLANDAGFITRAVANLQNYYLKAETYTKDEVNNLISSMAGGIELAVVAVLPVTGDSNTIYLLRREVGSNVYDQFVWFNNAWQQVGSTEVDLSQYYTKDEVNQLLSQVDANKQNKLTTGSGIKIDTNVISVDMGDTLTATGNKVDVKVASPYQAGAVKYDDNTIKMNASGQLYAVDAGGGGTEYVAGPNIQISGNVISATDTTYTAGDAIEIDRNNAISVKYDDETIHTNRRGELCMESVPITAGEGIKIGADGTISIKPAEVADAIDLADYQKKLYAGDNIIIDQLTNTISATGGGSGGGANWGQIGGTLSNQGDLVAALNNKQRKLVAGDNITIENISGTEARISATGGGAEDVYFQDIKGSPYDNIRLNNALNSLEDNLEDELDALDDKKQDKLSPSNKLPVENISGLAPVATSGSYEDLSNKPEIGNATIALRQNGVTKGYFRLNDTVSKEIDLDGQASTAWGDITGSMAAQTDLMNALAAKANKSDVPTVNNGTFTVKVNGVTAGSATMNQSGNTEANITVPTVGNGTLTIKQGSTTLGTFTANQSANKTITIPAASTVNNGTLTIQRNGTQKGTFTANQSSSSTVNINVPTFSYDSTTGVLTITDN